MRQLGIQLVLLQPGEVLGSGSEFRIGPHPISRESIKEGVDIR
jgi:hypothetical protein